MAQLDTNQQEEDAVQVGTTPPRSKRRASSASSTPVKEATKTPGASTPDSNTTGENMGTTKRRKASQSPAAVESSKEQQDHNVPASLSALRCKYCRVIVRFKSLLDKHQNLCKRFAKKKKTDPSKTSDTVDDSAPLSSRKNATPSRRVSNKGHQGKGLAKLEDDPSKMGDSSPLSSRKHATTPSGTVGIKGHQGKSLAKSEGAAASGGKNLLRCKSCNMVIKLKSMLVKHESACLRAKAVGNIKKEVGESKIADDKPEIVNQELSVAATSTSKKSVTITISPVNQSKTQEPPAVTSTSLKPVSSSPSSRCRFCNVFIRFKGLLKKHESACEHFKRDATEKKVDKSPKSRQTTPDRPRRKVMSPKSQQTTPERPRRRKATKVKMTVSRKQGVQHCRFCNVPISVKFEGLLAKHESVCQDFKENTQTKKDDDDLPLSSKQKSPIRTDVTSPETKTSPKSSRALRCRFCNVAIKFRSLLGKHESVCERFKTRETSTCELCNKIFNGKWGLQQHQLWCRKKKKTAGNNIKGKKALPMGAKPFMKLGAPGVRRQFSKVVPKEPDGPLHCCKHCKKTFDTIVSRMTHEATCSTGAGIIKQEPPVVVNLNSKYCLQCERVFFTMIEYEAHMATGRHRNVSGRYPCRHCGQEFEDEGGLVSHEAKIHPASGRGDGEKSTATLDQSCKLCKKSFRTRFMLNRHMETKHKGDGRSRGVLFSCRFCHKEFKDATLFKNHEVGYCAERYASVAAGGADLVDQGIASMETGRDGVGEGAGNEQRNGKIAGQCVDMSDHAWKKCGIW